MSTHRTPSFCSARFSTIRGSVAAAHRMQTLPPHSTCSMPRCSSEVPLWRSDAAPETQCQLIGGGVLWPRVLLSYSGTPSTSFRYRGSTEKLSRRDALGASVPLATLEPVVVMRSHLVGCAAKEHSTALSGLCQRASSNYTRFQAL